MSGCPTCATARRRQRAMPWTIDCGCTTTSMRSYGRPNRKCASITSRPLFISVAESIVILAPMSHVGCASASARADVAQLVAPCGRGTARRTRSARAATASGASPAVHCRAPSARSRPAGSRARGARAASTGPAGDQRLLVRERQVGAGAERGERGVEPGRADDGVQDDVGAALLDEADDGVGAVDGGAGRRRSTPCSGAAARSASALRPPARATTWSSRVSGADGERLGSDRTGGAEDRDPLHRVERYPAPPERSSTSGSASRGGCRSRGGTRRRSRTARTGRSTKRTRANATVII